ncbi:HNH endonuclease [Edaphobacter modestus]|uniref:HNH endonuclease n=1 Tax=Edaphobacter modestus TaxID=388466 RepID=A0A4Q7XZC8_9BACT|nr:HNH endonuclease [Edaphobacter modestus]RZU28893.1 HNH endonuclease [Edaphobacter modestus]
MFIDEVTEAGWTRNGRDSYRHLCNASVTKSGKGWISRTASCETVKNHATLSEAIAYLQNYDPHFWHLDETGAWGCYSGIWTIYGKFKGKSDTYAFVHYLPKSSDFPQHLVAVYRRYFFGQARCMKCSGAMSSLRFREMFFRPDGCAVEGDREEFLACECGYPVWIVESDRYYSATNSLRQYDRLHRRKQTLASAGGKYSTNDVRTILSLQNHRCIYCNVRFSDKVAPTKDHLLAVGYGGTNWPLNIVMACRSCNSRRCDIPFRTYCKLLSKAQNRRILSHLVRRLLALEEEGLTEEETLSFHIGLTLHDSKHHRYRMIMGMSAAARRNSASNKLLPRTSHLILKQENRRLKAI